MSGDSTDRVDCSLRPEAPLSTIPSTALARARRAATFPLPLDPSLSPITVALPDATINARIQTLPLSPVIYTHHASRRLSISAMHQEHVRLQHLGPEAARLRISIMKILKGKCFETPSQWLDIFSLATQIVQRS